MKQTVFRGQKLMFFSVFLLLIPILIVLGAAFVDPPKRLPHSPLRWLPILALVNMSLRRFALYAERVTFDEAGIHLRRMGRERQFFAWGDLQEVGLVGRVSLPRERSGYTSVVYFSMQPLSDEERLGLHLRFRGLTMPVQRDARVLVVEAETIHDVLDQELLSAVPVDWLHRCDLPWLLRKYPCVWSGCDGELHYLGKDETAALAAQSYVCGWVWPMIMGLLMVTAELFFTVYPV